MSKNVNKDFLTVSNITKISKKPYGKAFNCCFLLATCLPFRSLLAKEGDLKPVTCDLKLVTCDKKEHSSFCEYGREGSRTLKDLHPYGPEPYASASSATRPKK